MSWSILESRGNSAREAHNIQSKRHADEKQRGLVMPPGPLGGARQVLQLRGAHPSTWRRVLADGSPL